MSPHASTARHVHDVLVAAGIPAHTVPAPSIPIAGGAVIVGAPTLPDQATPTGCAPSEMVATITVVAAGLTPPSLLALYDLTDRVISALYEAGAWNPSTVPTTWQGQDTLPIPAMTVTVSVGYQGA